MRWWLYQLLSSIPEGSTWIAFMVQHMRFRQYQQVMQSLQLILALLLVALDVYPAMPIH